MEASSSLGELGAPRLTPDPQDTRRSGMPRLGRASLALVALAAVLVAIWWLDHMVIPYPTVGTYADETMYESPLRSLGYVAIVGAALVLARLAWWSRSAVVGTTYLVVGAFFAMLPWVYVFFFPHGLPAVLPTGLARVVKELRMVTAGPLDAFVTLGGVMAIVGVFVLARSLRAWVAAGEPDGGNARQAPSRLARWRMPRLGWAALALVAAAASLAVMGRADHAMNEVWARSFNPDNSSLWDQLLMPGAHLAVAGVVLAVALPAWRSRSVVVGVIYAVVSTFFLSLTAITYVQWSGSFATTASRIRTTTEGPLHAVTIIGAAMAVVGVVVVVRSIRDWLAAGEPSTPTASASRPILS